MKISILPLVCGTNRHEREFLHTICVFEPGLLYYNVYDYHRVKEASMFTTQNYRTAESDEGDVNEIAAIYSSNTDILIRKPAMVAGFFKIIVFNVSNEMFCCQTKPDSKSLTPSLH